MLSRLFFFDPIKGTQDFYMNPLRVTTYSNGPLRTTEGVVSTPKGLVRAEFEGRGDKECESSRTTRCEC